MAEEKVTEMVLTVDLQNSTCYKKVKKLLCKFPEIRDQTYDEKGNKVTIKVVSCSPEKIRDKLCCKAGGCIKSIEIPPPPKPKPEPPPKPKPEPQPKPKTPSPAPPPAQPQPPPPPPPPPPCKCKLYVDVQLQGFCCRKCCSGWLGGPCSCGGGVPCDPPPPPPPPLPPPPPPPPPCKCKLCVDVQPEGFCCRKGCSGSCGGRGRCDPCYGRPICDSWSGCGSGCGETQPDCSIM